MNIAEAVRKGEGIRRASWPKDWCIKPTDSELCCIGYSKENAVPRWEPQKQDLIANDWKPLKEVEKYADAK